MHKSGSSPLIPAPASMTKPTSSASACPYVPPESASSSLPNDKPAPPRNASTLSKLNPLNYMPKVIANERESDAQTVNLPLDREASTIPRGDGTGMWEYPSPQQMYNAMLRKGYTDTPAEHVESMVAVHNFLNEGAWAEILDWERRFGGGLSRGWQIAKRGEENAPLVTALLERKERMQKEKEIKWQDPSLVRFMGRPDEITPKARMLQVLGWLYPAKYNTEPPFDRHDWYVRRFDHDGNEYERRYVIDYYSGPPEPTGEPVFFLDVRPAVDTPTAACERLLRWGGDVWWRASGGSVREEIQKLQSLK